MLYKYKSFIDFFIIYFPVNIVFFLTEKTIREHLECDI